jgi:uroporphyrinogen-III decarboxylase
MSLTSIQEHNQEAKAIWDAFHAGQPIRPPVQLGTATQFFIFNDDLNPGEAVTFESYSTEASTMLDFQLRSQAWRAEKIAPFCDDPIGLPDEFLVKVDLQNYDEAAYFGAPVVFIPNQVPDTQPIFDGKRKNAFKDVGQPDPLKGGWYTKAHQIFDEMSERIHRNPDYLGRPIRMTPFGIWTCGPFTLAVALRGSDFLTDLYEDPQYAHDLLDYITEGTIQRIRAHMRFFGLSALEPDLSRGTREMFFADDSIQLISTKMLRQFVIPAYRKLITGLDSPERIKVHLCGDATRHFKTLRDEINAREFETGFPVDFGKLRQELGPNVLIHGGPNIMLLLNGTPEAVHEETRRILNSGIMQGGRFVLREGNNLAPRTPFANLDAMYQEARQFKWQI